MIQCMIQYMIQYTYWKETTHLIDNLVDNLVYDPDAIYSCFMLNIGAQVFTVRYKQLGINTTEYTPYSALIRVNRYGYTHNNKDIMQ